MGKRQWPKDNKPAQFSDLVDPVIKGIRFAYSMKRRNETRRIPWTGPDTGKSAVTPPPKEWLSRDSLAWDLEDQGRDALEILVGIAVQLGIEQGRRATIEKLNEMMLMFRLRLVDNSCVKAATEELMRSL